LKISLDFGSKAPSPDSSFIIEVIHSTVRMPRARSLSIICFGFGYCLVLKTKLSYSVAQGLSMMTAPTGMSTFL